MALPEEPSTAESTLCKLVDLGNILIQEIQALKAVSISLPLAVASGGTGATTAAAARVNLRVPTIELDAGLNIDWSLARHFQKNLTADTTFTMSNLSNGLDIQLLLTASGGDWTPTFPASVNFPSPPIPIPDGESSLYSMTRMDGVILAVITPYGVIV